jgi:hypothetical protein
LAMCTGIGLEIFKTWRANTKAREERQRREVAQINIAISGMGYNIETLLHAVSQHILPHHKESHILYNALEKASGDPEKLVHLAMSFPTYRALVTLCQEMHLIEWDFFKELPFIVEKDPEMLKQTGWLISQSRQLSTAIRNRNNNTLSAMQVTTQKGGLKFSEIASILHLQASIADSECITALQLFELFLAIEKQLEVINDTYKIKDKKSKLSVAKPHLEIVMDQLSEISKSTSPKMPT